MEPMLQWGLGVIRAVQSCAAPGLTVFMKAVTTLGAAPAYMILLPLVYWCVDEKKGFRLGLVVMISTWVNLTAKFFFRQPRPFWPEYDPSVGIIKETIYGLPSGHAQISLTMWMMIASWFKRWQAWAAAAVITLLVGFSRVYLGVHFPTDLFAGWAIGGAVLVLYFTQQKRLTDVLVKGGMRVQCIAAAAAAFVMILYFPEHARTVHNGVQSLTMPSATILGMGIGYALNLKYIRFAANANFGRRGAANVASRAARFVIGIVGVAAVFIITTMIQRALGITEDDSSLRLFVFVQFAVLEIWVFVGAPRVFQLFRLAEKPAA